MMSPIAFFHPYPKHLQITDALRHRLGGMQVGDKLPPEVDLGKEFGVSRDTVRQALEPLAKEGLIRRTQGRGSFVQKLPEARSVRKLTGAVEDFSSLGLKTHAVLLQSQVVKADGEVAQHLKLDPGSLIVRLDRLRYLDEEPLVYHIAYLLPEFGARVAHEDLRQNTIVNVLATKYRIPFQEDQQLVEADTADVAMAGHLRIPVGAPILYMRRIYLTAGEQPIAYFKSFFRADRYMYTVQLRQSAPSRSVRAGRAGKPPKPPRPDATANGARVKRPRL